MSVTVASHPSQLETRVRLRGGLLVRSLMPFPTAVRCQLVHLGGAGGEGVAGGKTEVRLK